MSLTIEETLVYILEQDEALAGLAPGVFPLLIPIDADLPAFCYQTIFDQETMAHDGGTGTRQARIQVTCTATTYAAAKALANAVDAALRGYQAAAVADMALEVESGKVENIRDGYNQTTKTATVRLDWSAIYLAG